MRDLVLAMTLGTVLSAAAVLPASAEDDVKGKWFNTFEVNGLPQPVWITVDHLDHGRDKGAQLVYSKPRDCFVNFEYGGEASGRHVFYRTSSPSGYCYDTFSRGRNVVLRAWLSPDANLIYDLMVDGKVIEKGFLKRS
jgi:hypothetical protein